MAETLALYALIITAARSQQGMTGFRRGLQFCWVQASAQSVPRSTCSPRDCLGFADTTISEGLIGRIVILSSVRL
ncbi:MAG: hypothetical protein H6643_10675 [Caldilineaceae bacterium]|nr:hypothetical protein [Caldilineaceae bacterium]